MLRDLFVYFPQLVILYCYNLIKTDNMNYVKWVDKADIYCLGLVKVINRTI